VKPKLNRRALAVTLATLFGLTGPDAVALGLVEAYQSALQNDPVYRAAIHENEAGQEHAAIGRAALLPNIGFNYNRTKNRADVTQPSFFGLQNTTHPRYESDSGSVTLRQSLLNFDALARYKQGLAQRELSDHVFSLRKQDLILRLVSAYADAQYAEYQVALMQATRDAYAELTRANERMLEKGEGTRTDVLESRARLDFAEAQLIEMRDVLTVNRNTLAAMIGKEVTSLDPISERFTVAPLQPASFDEWKSIALASNPEIAAQAQDVEVAYQEYNKARSAHLPRLDLVAGLTKGKSESLTQLNQETTTRSVGIQVNIPIYSGGAMNAAANQAFAKHEMAKATLEAKTNQVLIELRKHYSQTISSMSKIAALEKSVESAKLLVEATRQSIKGGVRINLNLLEAQQQLYTARRDLVQAQYNYLLSFLKLRAASGTLTGEDLNSLAGYFVRGATASSAPAAATAKASALMQAAMSNADIDKAAASALRRVGHSIVASSAKDADDAHGGAARVPTMATSTKSPGQATERALTDFLSSWARAWSSRDVDAYLAHYDREFRPADGRLRNTWEQERRQRIATKGRIEVICDSPEIKIEGDRAILTFRQVYKSDRHNEAGRKTLELTKRDGGWKISRELAAG